MRQQHLAISLVFCSTSAFARVHLPGEAPAPERSATVAADPTGPGIEARYGAFGAFVSGGGIAATWRSDSWQGGIVAYHGNADLTDSASGLLASEPALAGRTLDKLTLAATEFEAEARATFPYDLIAAVGVGWRRIEGHAALAAADGSGAITSDSVVTGIEASVALASFWTWPKGFFIGVDWLGVAMPLTSVRRVSGRGSGADFDALQSETDRLAGMLGRSPSVILLVGAAGYRF